MSSDYFVTDVLDRSSLARRFVFLVQLTEERTEPEAAAKPKKRTEAECQSWRRRIVEQQHSPDSETGDYAGHDPRRIVANEICTPTLSGHERQRHHRAE